MDAPERLSSFRKWSRVETLDDNASTCWVHLRMLATWTPSSLNEETRSTLVLLSISCSSWLFSFDLISISLVFRWLTFMPLLVDCFTRLSTNNCIWLLLLVLWLKWHSWCMLYGQIQTSHQICNSFCKLKCMRVQGLGREGRNEQLAPQNQKPISPIIISVGQLLICIFLWIAKTDRSCRLVLCITSAKKYSTDIFYTKPNSYLLCHTNTNQS